MNKRSIFKKFVSTWTIIISIFSLTIHAAKTQKLEKPISLQEKDLKYWNKSSEAWAIQQSLRALVVPRPDYPRVAEPFESAKKYRSLYNTPFLVLEAEPNGFGGFWALIVFKDYPKVLCLWVYEIDKNVFEIREIEPLRVTLNKTIMDELKDRRIAPFWMTL